MYLSPEQKRNVNFREWLSAGFFKGSTCAYYQHQT